MLPPVLAETCQHMTVLEDQLILRAGDDDEDGDVLGDEVEDVPFYRTFAFATTPHLPKHWVGSL